MKKTFNRRQFLRGTAAATAGSGLLLSSPLTFGQALSQRPPLFRKSFSDYKALVVIFLYGGNDGFNLLVPRSNAEYNQYALSRQNLAVPQADLLPISPTTTDGAQYGLHPSVPELKAMFDGGDAAMIANVGTLIEPATKDQIDNYAVALPEQLFSHSDQQEQWQYLNPGDATSGWAGRVADNIAPDQNLGFLTNITAFGQNFAQVGNATSPYSIDTGGVIDFDSINPENSWEVPRRTAFTNLLARNHSNRFEQAYADLENRTMAINQQLGGALEAFGEFSTEFPDSGLAAQLRIVGKMIGIQETLQVNRQIYFVGMGGFDTHDNHNQVQPGLFEQLSQATSAFNSAMAEIGKSDDVTAFTASDFGRTLTSNGDGTDHGWGSHQFVFGGAVNGGDIYGTMPNLEIEGPDDTRGGRIIPTQSADQYTATLLNWFGFDDSELDMLLPNLQNFSVRNLGFMG